MAIFAYKALDKQGKNKKGVIEADSQKQARQLLREQGLMPIEMNESDDKKSSKKKTGASFFGLSLSPKASTADLSLITRQLATLIEASMPLDEALKAVAAQSEKEKISSLVMQIRAKVLEGFTLADSFAEFPSIFDNLFCSTVAAGEKSGHLDTVLNRLADYMENKQETSSKIVQALVYPVVLLVIAIGIISLLLAVVVPKVVEQFIHMGNVLPLATRILIKLSDLLRDYGLFALIFLVACILLFKQMLKSPSFLLSFHKNQLNLPVIGKVIKGLNTARYARTLSILSASAVPLIEAMKISANVLTNNHIKELAASASVKVKEGTSLFKAMSGANVFPPMMLYMIASGEKSGQLDTMLDRAAKNQEREFDVLMGVALGLMGPLVLVLMASVVLFIVIAILQPIIELNNMVGV